MINRSNFILNLEYISQKIFILSISIDKQQNRKPAIMSDNLSKQALQ